MLSSSRDGKKKARVDARLQRYETTGKRCACCHAQLAVSEFDRCAPRADGLQSNCRTCNKLRLTLDTKEGGMTTWRTVRDAMRAKAAKG